MSTERQSVHGEWSSSLAFILAATGAAVGLGNIWKFPYITGNNGGGAFVLVYLICIIVIGIPLLMAEIFVGRHGRQNPASSMRNIAIESGRSPLWGIVGFLCLLSGFIILSYYSVITGWTLDYVVHAATDEFTHHDPQLINNLFTNLVSNPMQLLLWNTVVMLATTLVVAKGVRKGLERTVMLMFPGMLILLIVLLGYSIGSGYFGAGLTFLFHPNFSKLTPGITLSALGHAFFTLSLATGSIMMYGAYLPKSASITKASIVIVVADTLIALLAGLVIFPIVFANNLEPASGPGLIFKTLPLAFGQMPHGTLFATLFFLMLFFAAFTSAISLLEPAVAWLIETFKMRRSMAALSAGGIIWLLGFGTIFSFNILSDFTLFHMNIFESLDYLSANIMLPLGGLFIAIFAAWSIKKETSLKALQFNNGKFYKYWRFTLRYISPIAIIIIFLNFIGLIKLNGG